ncbi:MAG: hypothetical protein ACR2M0_13125 [Chloroflexia bacterium]
MRKFDSKAELRVRPRPMEAVTVQFPVDALASLEKVAEHRDMSDEALIQFYIGQGLRQDLSRLFSDRVIQVTADALAQHGLSEEEVEMILEEIRAGIGK